MVFIQAVHQQILSNKFLIVRMRELLWRKEDCQKFYREHEGRSQASSERDASLSLERFYRHPSQVRTDISSVTLCVWLFATPWTAARQASLSITNSSSLLKVMPVEWVMPRHHLILCCPLLLLPSVLASGSFPMSQFFASGGQSIGVSASVLPMNIQDWFPLGLSGLISLQCKGLSGVFSQYHSSKASILRHSAFFIVQLSHPYMTTVLTNCKIQPVF